jgi:hypothetical protein
MKPAAQTTNHRSLPEIRAKDIGPGLQGQQVSTGGMVRSNHAACVALKEAAEAVDSQTFNDVESNQRHQRQENGKDLSDDIKDPTVQDESSSSSEESDQGEDRLTPCLDDTKHQGGLHNSLGNVQLPGNFSGTPNTHLLPRAFGSSRAFQAHHAHAAFLTSSPAATHSLCVPLHLLRTGRWTLDEKLLFLYGLRKFGKGRWKKMKMYLPNRYVPGAITLTPWF